MEELLTNAFQSGNATAIIAAVVVYVIIWLQRNNTKKTRDTDKDNLQTRIALMENEIADIKRLDLDARLAAIETSLEYIKHILENRK